MKLRATAKLALLTGIFLGLAAASTKPVVTGDASIAQRLTHEVRVYPQYSVWDNVAFRVENGQVHLLGQVTQPYKKTDLGRLAASVPGVTSVTNDLTVLPFSTMDDRLRIQVARAIYGSSALSRYGMGAQPSIHIIVENGRVTLEGFVANEMDKQIAGMRASSAGLSFGAVTNNLQVENAKPHKG